MTDGPRDGEITETWKGHVDYVDEQGLISATVYETNNTNPVNQRSVEQDIAPSDIPEHIRRQLGQYAEFLCKVTLTHDREWLSKVREIVPIKPRPIDQETVNEALETFSFLKDPRLSE